MVNNVGLYGSKVAEGCSAFQRRSCSMMLYACYLPPENSVWGHDPNTFYADLLTELCMHNETDAVISCGDFNGRIGNMADVDINVDVDIANRTSIDRIKHAHGDALIEFVVDSKLAILNGRIDPQNDNFTFVSPRGKSVVDYLIVPQDCLHLVKSFKVDVATDGSREQT